MCALFRPVESPRPATRGHPEGLWEETTWFERHRGILWRAAALGLWGGTLLWFYHADRLILYIRSTYHPLAAGAGVVLLALALVEVLNLVFRHRAADCCQEHDHGDHGEAEHGDGDHAHSRGRLAALILILPLIINALVPSTGLTSYAVGKRATQLDYSALASQMKADWEAQLAQAKQLSEEYPELNIAQILGFASQDVERARGMKVSCVGFVYREPGAPPERFQVVRFRMWCCAADAQPFYLLVIWPEAASLATDQWVRVRGVIAFTQGQGGPQPNLQADGVEGIKARRNQYM
jgi:uncharacterized repeat protein (TIGR03943 family)